MKFKLESAKVLFNKKHDTERMAMLSKLGFVFKNTHFSDLTYDEKIPIYIEITTLEELIELVTFVDTSLILDKGKITIYNGYVE